METVSVSGFKVRLRSSDLSQFLQFKDLYFIVCSIMYVYAFMWSCAQLNN